MNSKKFNAAEKHFEKKRVELTKQIDHYKQWAQSVINENRELKQTIYELENENIHLKEHIERLLAYTELSQDDIKNACEKDKHLSDLYSAMTSISKMVNIF